MDAKLDVLSVFAGRDSLDAVRAIVEAIEARQPRIACIQNVYASKMVVALQAAPLEFLCRRLRELEYAVAVSPLPYVFGFNAGLVTCVKRGLEGKTHFSNPDCVVLADGTAVYNCIDPEVLVPKLDAMRTRPTILCGCFDDIVPEEMLRILTEAGLRRVSESCWTNIVLHAPTFWIREVDAKLHGASAREIFKHNLLGAFPFLFQLFF